MNRNHHKLKHIQETNRIVEQRLLKERQIDNLIGMVLNESRLPLIQQGDDFCDILCQRKQAAYGSNGDIVKKIQNALANCGHNVEFEGGGINLGCKDDFNKCDGKFRQETKKAVESFQQSIPTLVVDGSVGRETLLALKSEGCIDFEECPCDEKTQASNDVTEDNQWWLKIGIQNPSYGDCRYINGCISYALNNPANQFSWEDFLSCMKSKIGGDRPRKNKCENCPKYSDYKTWPKGNTYTDLGVVECIKNGCTVKGSP